MSSYLSAQSILIDITIFVTSSENFRGSSSYRSKKLYEFKLTDISQVKSGSTYLGHNHNLVAWEAQLFDGFSENDFGKSIRIDLIIHTER